MKIKKVYEDFKVEEVLKVGHTKNDCIVVTLEKTDWDTIGVIKALARQLKISPKRIGYAGLKDRRAVTMQKISVTGVSRNQIESINLSGVFLKDIEQGDRIRLGDHSGNKFDILVRDASLTAEDVARVNQEFPNYFGQQRFGNVRPITHEVGKALIKNDIDKAALIFLAKPFPEEPHYEVRKELWETQDFEKAKREYPHSLVYERAMLNNIDKGAEKAFKALPMRLNTLFIHAYQAYLFNKIVVERCKYVPVTEVEPDDVVIAQFQGKKVVTLAGSHNLDMIIEKGLCAAAPIIGYQTNVKGRMNTITKTLLEKEGVTKEDFLVKGFPQLSSRGTYREILGKASDFSYTLEDNNVRLRFFLPKGQYATVFLEELFSLERRWLKDI